MLYGHIKIGLMIRANGMMQQYRYCCFMTTSIQIINPIFDYNHYSNPEEIYLKVGEKIDVFSGQRIAAKKNNRDTIRCQYG